jgi:hypothetical protein
VVDEELPVASAHEAFDADGSLRDPMLEAALAEILEKLLTAAGAPLATAASPFR